MSSRGRRGRAVRGVGRGGRGRRRGRGSEPPHVAQAALNSNEPLILAAGATGKKTSSLKAIEKATKRVEKNYGILASQKPCELCKDEAMQSHIPPNVSLFACVTVVKNHKVTKIKLIIYARYLKRQGAGRLNLGLGAEETVQPFIAATMAFNISGVLYLDLPPGEDCVEGEEYDVIVTSYGKCHHEMKKIFDEGGLDLPEDVPVNIVQYSSSSEDMDDDYVTTIVTAVATANPDHAVAGQAEKAAEKEINRMKIQRDLLAIAETPTSLSTALPSTSAAEFMDADEALRLLRRQQEEGELRWHVVHLPSLMGDNEDRDVPAAEPAVAPVVDAPQVDQDQRLKTTIEPVGNRSWDEAAELDEAAEAIERQSTDQEIRFPQQEVTSVPWGENAGGDLRRLLDSIKERQQHFDNLEEMHVNARNALIKIEEAVRSKTKPLLLADEKSLLQSLHVLLNHEKQERERVEARLRSQDYAIASLRETLRQRCVTIYALRAMVAEVGVFNMDNVGQIDFSNPEVTASIATAFIEKVREEGHSNLVLEAGERNVTSSVHLALSESFTSEDFPWPFNMVQMAKKYHGQYGQAVPLTLVNGQNATAFETTVFYAKASDLLVFVGNEVWWMKKMIDCLFNQFANACVCLLRPSAFISAVSSFVNDFLKAEMPSSVERWNFWGSFMNPLARKKIGILLDLMRHFSLQLNRLMHEASLEPLSSDETEYVMSQITGAISHKLGACRRGALNHKTDPNKSSGYFKYVDLRNQCDFVYPRHGPRLKDPFLAAFTEQKDLTSLFDTQSKKIAVKSKNHINDGRCTTGENFVGNYLRSFRDEDMDWYEKYLRDHPDEDVPGPLHRAAKDQLLPDLTAVFLQQRPKAVDIEVTKELRFAFDEEKRKRKVENDNEGPTVRKQLRRTGSEVGTPANGTTNE